MNNSLPNPVANNQKTTRIILNILFLYVLVAAVYFRFTGLFWGEYQYLHPDERFLIWVGTDISPVKDLAEYFNTAESSLNPHNRGHGFYVYGTLPMFIARYIVEGVFGHSGFMEMTQVGRAISSLADCFTVMLVYLAARRLYDQHVAVLAAAFSAAAVLHIQQSHFFTMDTFITMFSFLAFYFAILAMKAQPGYEGSTTKQTPVIEQAPEQEDTSGEHATPALQMSTLAKTFIQDPLFLPSLGFGVALGMAVASKLNAAPMALVLPAAMLIRILALPVEKRERRTLQALSYLAIAALVSLLVFRIFQPYAFSGPGFFGLKPNPQWVQNITEQRAQSSVNVDFPPAMQWARRPIWFSFQNMTSWGLGLPLGILAWAGFLWSGWRSFISRRSPSDWTSHVLIWGWTAFYFTWQSIQFNPTMRYELPIYPTLVIFAAWAVVTLYGRVNGTVHTSQRRKWTRPVAFIIGGVVLITTYAYAFAFSQIYTRSITRIEASRWIYQNIPGPINLPIQADAGVYNQIIPFPYNYRITAQLPYSVAFTPKVAGTLAHVFLPRVWDENPTHEMRNLSLQIDSVPPSSFALAKGNLIEDFSPKENGQGRSFTVALDQPVRLDPGKKYNLSISLLSDTPISRLDGKANLYFDTLDSRQAPFEQTVQTSQTTIYPNTPVVVNFSAEVDGALSKLFLAYPPGEIQTTMPKVLGVNLQYLDQNSETFYSDVSIQEDIQRHGYIIQLNLPLPVSKGEKYRLILAIEPQGGAIALSGQGLANEGEWDDGLPLRVDDYDGFGGVYPQDLNFNMYWDDNPKKLERFTRILDQADYLAISSNRQWGSLPRMPERFPLTSIYYRNLIGCPPEYSIEYCYRVAIPGKFKGNLGYDLVRVFTSNPTLGPLSLNDQFAEEAFTVYDHPKVLIFKKSPGYDSEKVKLVLGSVNFSQIIRLPPLKFGSNPANLLLPEERWVAQQQGGTWSELFNPQALQNRYPVLSILVWYLSIFILGLIAYPLLRLAMPALADHSYPLARTAGLLLLSYLVWLAGSVQIPFTRATISIAIGFLALLAGWLTYQQRAELRQEWQSNRRYFLIVECLALGLFLAFLVVRIGNPDLWHPWKGGEKPMDFSYFNAVLKSTSFPPYDPWFAGGYLNYYYFGFVLVGTMVKWLGITPAIAYNLILPTLFSLTALSAFSLAWNLSLKARARRAFSAPEPDSGLPDKTLSPYLPAFAAALGMAVLGNLGAVKMIFQGYQKIVAPDGVIEGVRLITRLSWTVQGFLETLQGARLPYRIGDWYWLPSRIIPALGDVEPITEFPYFTVLYADLHAHLIALPLTLLALSLIIAIVLGKARWRNPGGAILWFLLAGLAIGALRPTNTWDLPTYLALGLLGVIYSVWRNYSPSVMQITLLGAQRWNALLANLNPCLFRLLISAGSAALLAGLSLLLFHPYTQWYALGYTHINLWKGAHTPFSAYLNHWGLFMIVIIAWMIWETRDWLAKTPASALSKLKPYQLLIQFLLALVFITTLALQIWRGISIAWFVLPTAIWAAILILRPNQPDAKRIVLFLIGSGLMLTLMVEVIVLRGDVGRMNTVFKFYLQVWTMFSISAAAALSWLWPALDDWRPAWRWAWQASFTILIAGASLYPMMATLAKIEDRMGKGPPHTLDGMAFMRHATYTDEWGAMDLSQDYRAIRWMQENVSGSPVIVEANLRNLYRWGSRYSIYTGLPGVVGWEWHQQQQRVVVPGSWVSNRIQEVDAFYLTTDLNQAAEFLRKYNIRYIIVGQQERGHYPGPGLEKFEQVNGLLWQEVYRDGDTVIYKVSEVTQ